MSVTPKDVLQSHQEFVAKVREQIKAVAAGKPLASPLPLGDKGSLLQAAQARLDSARQAKAEATQGFDREIAEQEKTIARLQQEIAGAKAPQPAASQGNVEPTSSTGKKRPSQPAKSKAPGKPAAKKARKTDKARRP